MGWEGRGGGREEGREGVRAVQLGSGVGVQEASEIVEYLLGRSDEDAVT